jgi:TRAP-type uncharacterized transport system fused permease subunit
MSNSVPATADVKSKLYSLEFAKENPLPWAIGFALIALFAVWHVATNVFLNEPGLWQNTIHFGGFAFLAAVTTRTFNRGKQSRASLIANTLFGLAIACSALWIAGAENGIYERTLAKTGLPWQFGPLDWMAGFIVIIGVIELTRRLTGWVIPILVIISSEIS